MAGKLLDYPLDTVKVLLQTEGGSTGSTTTSSNSGGGGATPRYRGAWHCLTHTVETQGGVASLYRGLSAPLLGSMAENAVLFWAYGNCKQVAVALASGGDLPLMAAKYDEDHLQDDDLTLWQLSLAGAGAGLVAATVLTPVELVKCRMQVQNNLQGGSSGGTGGGGRFVRYAGPMDVLTRTIREEGIVRGLYRGHSSTLLREIPGNFVWYGTYEAVCRSMLPVGGSKKDLSMATHLLGGAAAGVGYWTAFYPADTVKSMIQTHPDHAGKGFVEMFQTILRTDGVRGLYRGWGITAARAAPAHAAIFAVYEKTMQLLGGQ